jgi:uncharacterized protein YprB with RNaseH-like and TPR domain/L-rhamnose mutarotase
LIGTMGKLRDKLNHLEKNKIKKKWEAINSQKGLSTREKLEKLVDISLKREKKQQQAKQTSTQTGRETPEPDFQEMGREEPGKTHLISEFSYPLDLLFGKFKLEEWKRISSHQLAMLFGEEECQDVFLSPLKLLFLDTETTGLAGGTGTIPFMLGFGFFDQEAEADSFRVKIFILNDLYKEDAFLAEVDRFLESREFSATVTYNGKSFDFPLLEARYILQRKRFPLLKRPHLDFLFPARTLWKHTFDSRKLGYLGETLLGISRDDDVDPNQIPSLYFNYLRSKSFFMMQKVAEHNAMDLVGLAALVLLAVKYQENFTYADDEGEILGIAKLCEKYGNLAKAQQLYQNLTQCAVRKDILVKAVKGLAVLKKKKKLFQEASELWQMLADSCDHYAVRELSIHLEHREKNYVKALEYLQKALAIVDLTEIQRQDFEKRWNRINKKIKALEKEEEKP